MRFGDWEGGILRAARDRAALTSGANPFTCLRLPKIFNLRMDPFERADVVSDQYNDWLVKNAYLTGIATLKASDFLNTFVTYPPSQAGKFHGRPDSESIRRAHRSRTTQDRVTDATARRR